LYLLSAKFTNVFEWRSSLRAISKINTETIFTFNKEGITFRGMDPTHVALLEINFPKSSFTEFNSSQLIFGINVKDFLKSIIGIKKNDTVELIIKRKNVLKIKINDKLKNEIDLTLIDKSKAKQPLPRIETKSKISVALDLLGDILINIEKDSEQLMINSFEGGIEFSGKEGIENNKINLKKGSADLPLHDIEEGTISSYDIEFMAKIIKSIGKSCKIVNMEYGNQTPVRMIFEMPSRVKAEYYLAPRVEY
jgi:proliferating cell nuclear antigen